MSGARHQPGTRLPLRWIPDEGNFIVNGSGMIVAEVPCQGVENDKQVGAYLVQAANAYPRLVAAVDDLQRLFSRQWCSGDEGARQAALVDARALLRAIGEAS